MTAPYLPGNIAGTESGHGDNITHVHHNIACASWVPPMEGQGKARRYTPRQFLLLLIHSDLMRWGLSLPFAGRLVTRIAETMLFSPDAGELVIEFRVNRASFFYGVERGDLAFDRGDAAHVAGPARFRVTFDLAVYWDAVNTAFATYGQARGGGDEA